MPMGAADTIIQLGFIFFCQVLVVRSLFLFERKALGTSIIKGFYLRLGQYSVTSNLRISVT